MKSIVGHLYIVFFFLILLVPFFSMNHESGSVSEIDNKVLAGFPGWGEGFQDGVELYIRERLGGRDEMIMAYTLLNDFVFHEMVHPSYTYGKDGYVFPKMHSNIVYSDFHYEFVQMVSKIDTYCKDRGTKFYFLFSPEKQSVYSRYLPEGVNYNDEWVDELIYEMENRGITCVDNKAYLTNLSYDKAVFNQKYDAGHWNDLGCFYGMNNLYARMQIDIPEVTLLCLDDFDITMKHEDTLAVSKFPINEDVPLFQTKVKYEDLSEKARREILLNQNYSGFHYYINKEANANRKPKILIFQGSYLNGRPTFLIANASEEVGVHNYQNILNFDYYYNIFSPDVVIFEVAEYVFDDQYFSYQDMKNFDLPPALAGETHVLGEEAGRLLAEIEEYPSSVIGTILRGNCIDTLHIDRSIPDSKYVYLYSNDYIYDLRKEDGGKGYQVSVEGGKLQADKSAKLVIQNEEGIKYYSSIEIREMIPILGDEVTYTENTRKVGNKYIFDSYVDKNSFSWVGLMVYDSKTDTYLDVFGMGGEESKKVSDSYVHNSESGIYTVTVKANSTLADESVSYEVYLERGQRYYVEYMIDSFSETQIKISDFKFVH